MQLNEDSGLGAKRRRLDLVQNYFVPPGLLLPSDQMIRPRTRSTQQSQAVRIKKIDLNFSADVTGQNLRRRSSESLESEMWEPTQATLKLNGGESPRLSTSRSETSDNGVKIKDAGTVSRERFRCPMCSAIVTSIQSFWNHYTVAHQILSQQLPTEQCIRAGFVVKEGNPRQNNKNVVKLYCCSRCSSIYKNPEGLQNHMALKHFDTILHKDDLSYNAGSSSTIAANDNNQYPCAICRSKFKSQIDLANHIRVRHPDPLQIGYTCEMCSNSEVYDDENALEAHQRVFHAQLLVAPEQSNTTISPTSFDFRCAHDFCRNLIFKGETVFAHHCRIVHVADVEVDNDDYERRKQKLIPCTFFCHYCKRHLTYEYNSMMRSHIQLYHKSILQSIPCDECVVVCGNDLLFRFHKLSHQKFWRRLTTTQQNLLEKQICYSDQVVIKCPLGTCQYLAPFTNLDDFEHHVSSVLHGGLKVQDNPREEYETETPVSDEFEANGFKVKSEEEDGIEFLGVVGKASDNGIFPDL